MKKFIFFITLIIGGGSYWFFQSYSVVSEKENYTPEELAAVSAVAVDKNAKPTGINVFPSAVSVGSVNGTVHPPVTLAGWSEFSKKMGLSQIEDLLLSKGEMAPYLRILLTINRRSEGIDSNNDYLNWAQSELNRDPKKGIESIDQAIALMTGDDFAIERGYLVQMVGQLGYNPDAKEAAKKTLFNLSALPDDSTQAAGGNTSLLALNSYFGIETDSEQRKHALESFQNSHQNDELKHLAENFYAMAETSKNIQNRDVANEGQRAARNDNQVDEVQPDRALEPQIEAVPAPVYDPAIQPQE